MVQSKQHLKKIERNPRMRFTQNTDTDDNRKMIFFKLKQKSEHMAQGTRQPKFERNPCNTFRDIATRTTDGQTTYKFDFVN